MPDGFQSHRVDSLRPRFFAGCCDPCEAACLRGIERIAATVDAVDYVTYANLANLNTALRGGLLDLIEVQLKCVGGGPTLDFEDAAEFLARFQPAIAAVLRRRLQ